jgi:hypothetical protein
MKLLTWSLTALLVASPSAFANIDIQFDFSYDTSGFFNSTNIQTLNAAASVFETRITDSLSAINSGGLNNFQGLILDPSDINQTQTLSTLSVAANVIKIYVGSDNLGGFTIGAGGSGGYSCSGLGSFCANAVDRGQTNTTGNSATDFATWGGMISFNSSTSWYFGQDQAGLTNTQFDFYTVAVHEIAHVLGFGLAPSFEAQVNGSNFNSSETGTVALSNDLAHWAPGTMSTVGGTLQETVMDPDITPGTRKYFTDLDYAGMAAIGWSVVTPVPESSISLNLLAGGLLLGLLYRRNLGSRRQTVINAYA